MLLESDRLVANEFRRRLKSFLPILDFRIFGSRARGDAHAESDLDVFIEVEIISPEQRRRVSEIAWEVGFKMDRVISPIVATREQLENGAIGANPLILHIEREGIRP